jgi:hypothetical protein
LKKNRKIYIIILSLALLFTGAAQSQHKIKKIHAWFEPVTSGIQAKDDTAKNEYQGNWFIYLQSGTKNVQVYNVWINKELYTVKSIMVESPVVKRADNSSSRFMEKDSVLLVPGTKDNVYKLTLGSYNGGLNPKPALPSSQLKYVVVIQYSAKKNNKKKYKGTSEIKYMKARSLS